MTDQTSPRELEYRLLYPKPGSVRGRSFVDPVYPEDVANATYEEVHAGTIEADNMEAALERIFVLFNHHRHRPARIRSLAVGDVVQVGELFRMCAATGWIELAGPPRGIAVIQDPRMAGDVRDEVTEALECALEAWRRFDHSGDIQSFEAARADTLDAASLFQKMAEAMAAAEAGS